MTATMKFRITEDADAMTLIVEAIGNIEKKYELLDLVYRAYVGLRLLTDAPSEENFPSVTVEHGRHDRICRLWRRQLQRS
jgi:hypothetical protein